VVRSWQQVWYKKQPRFDLVIDQHHGLPWYAPWWCGTRSVAYIHEVLDPSGTYFIDGQLEAGKVAGAMDPLAIPERPVLDRLPSTKEALHRHGVRDVTLIPYGVATVAIPQLDPSRSPSRSSWSWCRGSPPTNGSITPCASCTP